MIIKKGGGGAISSKGKHTNSVECLQWVVAWMFCWFENKTCTTSVCSKSKAFHGACMSTICEGWLVKQMKASCFYPVCEISWELGDKQWDQIPWVELVKETKRLQKKTFWILCRTILWAMNTVSARFLSHKPCLYDLVVKNISWGTEACMYRISHDDETATANWNSNILIKAKINSEVDECIFAFMHSSTVHSYFCL